MTSQILVRVDKETKDKFQRLSRFEHKSVNEKLRELMKEYVEEHNIEIAMKGLWSEIGSSLKEKGYKVSDVEKTIRKVRSGK
jgi:uncharacterized membrane protein YvbJ